MKETRAILRFLRMSPRKVRLIVDGIRGLSVVEAERVLLFSPRAAARPVLKLLRSATANATNNDKLRKDALRVKEIRADMGPTLKRWRARAMGAAAPIRKRMTHVTLVLEGTEAKEVKSEKAKGKSDVAEDKSKGKNEKVKVEESKKSPK